MGKRMGKRGDRWRLGDRVIVTCDNVQHALLGYLCGSDPGAVGTIVKLDGDRIPGVAFDAPVLNGHTLTDAKLKHHAKDGHGRYINEDCLSAYYAPQPVVVHAGRVVDDE